ncbi:MAG: DNA repair protein RecN, partial [Pseudoxanthomonas sp.]
WLRDSELDDGRDCQLRRVIRADGGSRAFINGRSVTLAQLTELAGLLVEIHGQHEHQALLSRASQLELLDAYARNDAERSAVRNAAQAWSALLHERDALFQQGDVSDRINYLEHQFKELEREDLAAADIESLSASHRRQANASGLIDACNAAFARLAGEEAPSVSRQLQQTRSELARMAEHEPRLREVDSLLESANIQLDEALVVLDKVRDDLDADPAQFMELERRLTRIHDLARKHRVAPEQLAARRDAIAAELDGLRGAGERLLGLNTEIESATAAWRTAAAKLGKTRRTAAASLSRAISALIAELGMAGGHFEIAIEPGESERPDPQGSERVEFLVSANAGQPPRALRKVASGGELSRISLAIEVAALGSDAVPTMGVDEVDSGIGGAVSDIVGQKLRALGEKRQVLCVTHLPQVAAQGHAHYRVSKAPVEGMTQSSVELLGAKDREEELARMLGGVEVSKEARAAAKRLLSDVA